MQESELQIEGYDIFTNIQEAKRGVLIYTKSSLAASPSPMSDLCNFDEHCWCEIKLEGKDRLLIGCIYRSPNSNEENNSKLIQDLTKICSKSNSHVLICGDFNYPNINWENGKCSSHGASCFLEGIRDCFLHQHVTNPTHHRPNQEANILDLVLTNEEGMVSRLDHKAPIGKSHHSVLTFTLNCYKEVAPFKPRFLYEKADYPNMARFLREIEWSSLLDELSCEEAWDVLCVKIQEATSQFVPKSKPPNKRKKPLWMTAELLCKVRDKQAAYRKYMNTKERTDYLKYARVRNQLKWSCRKAARDHERNIAGNAKNNPKAVFSYAKKKMKTKTGIADLTKTGGEIVSSSKEKADVLNEFFSSVFTKEDKSSIPDFKKVSYNEPLLDLTITPEQVLKKLKELNPNKATGPDNIPSRLLKELSDVLCDPIARVMKKSIQEQYIPINWKKAHVVPIHKCDKLLY